MANDLEGRMNVLAERLEERLQQALAQNGKELKSGSSEVILALFEAYDAFIRTKEFRSTIGTFKAFADITPLTIVSGEYSTRGRDTHDTNRYKQHSTVLWLPTSRIAVVPDCAAFIRQPSEIIEGNYLNRVTSKNAHFSVPLHERCHAFYLAAESSPFRISDEAICRGLDTYHKQKGIVTTIQKEPIAVREYGF